jgi:hypothetical protein
MKLIRYGNSGSVRPGLVDSAGRIRGLGEQNQIVIEA